MYIATFLKEKKYDALLSLPFMRPPFQKRFQSASMKELLPYFDVDLSFNDVDTQMKYQQLLNQLFRCKQNLITNKINCISYIRMLLL